MFMFQEISDTSWELTSPVYDVDVQSFLVNIDQSGFVDEIVPPETAGTIADLPATDPAPMVIADALPVAADPVVPPVDPAAVDPLTPDPGTATPVTVADLSTVDTTGADSPVDLDAGAVADAVASALATLDGSFFDLASFNFSDISFGPFS